MLPRPSKRTVGQALCLWSLLCCAFAMPGTPPHATSQPTTRPGERANLPANGRFEQVNAKTGLPVGWTSQRPDNVKTTLSDDRLRRRVVEMTGDKKLMGGYGVDLLSGRIPCKANTYYRCTGYTRSDGPNMKVFVKGYARVTRRVEGKLETFDDQVYQTRKDIAPTEEWTPFSLDFHIVPSDVFSDHQHEIEYVRIKLWAYWPAGTCWFDDIRFVELDPLAASQQRDKRPVTHMDVPPRLLPSVEDDGAVDEADLWRAALNAFNDGRAAEAWPVVDELLSRAPENIDYHVLAARCLVKLEKLDLAEKQVSWLLAGQRKLEPWQRDWTLVVRGKLLWLRERRADAVACLEDVVRSAASEHARAAARQLLLDMRQTSQPSKP